MMFIAIAKYAHKHSKYFNQTYCEAITISVIYLLFIEPEPEDEKTSDWIELRKTIQIELGRFRNRKQRYTYDFKAIHAMMQYQVIFSQLRRISILLKWPFEPANIHKTIDSIF